METPAAQIQEYESQLANVTDLLATSPEDESLLSLKKDLEELLALTRSSAASSSTDTADEVERQPIEQSSEAQSPLEAAATLSLPPAPASGDPEDLKKKKVKKIKDFEIPEHLQAQDTDTEAETNRKRRAVKALKSKWRAKKKDAESTKKQQSWQNFQSKKGKKRTDTNSIFATQEGVNARVGVISAGSMTEFGERKRHKHSS